MFQSFGWSEGDNFCMFVRLDNYNFGRCSNQLVSVVC